MKILAIDSSGIAATVAVVSEECVIGEYTTNFNRTHSQTLLPMVDTLLKSVDMKLDDMDAIAVSSGPGSFTGLRIGASTVKGFGLVLDKDIIDVPTLDALAYNMYGTDKIICPIMNARRNQVYTGLYKASEDSVERIEENKSIDIVELVEELNNRGEEVVFTGDGVNDFRDVIKENIKVKCTFAPAHMREQRAGSVGVLAINYYKRWLEDKEFDANNGCKVVTADEFAPDYLKVSQAERERNEKLKECND